MVLMIKFWSRTSTNYNSAASLLFKQTRVAAGVDESEKLRLDAALVQPGALRSVPELLARTPLHHNVTAALTYLQETMAFKNAADFASGEHSKLTQ